MMRQLWKVVPWGDLLVRSAGPAPARPATRPAPSQGDHPGCQIAEACLFVYGCLEELAEGRGGYGVLRLGKARLGEAVRLAESIGKPDLAQDMQRIAAQLPEVHTSETAARVAQEMRPIKASAYRLGRVCGLSQKGEA